mmetsp:Transcript_33491/g.71494  ORF Transcript_33491/g.71494 Transcript_33491/m.71494 type:complete len:201 (+) Transcript_33491:104-706(+)
MRNSGTHSVSTGRPCQIAFFLGSAIVNTQPSPRMSITPLPIPTDTNNVAGAYRVSTLSTPRTPSLLGWKTVEWIWLRLRSHESRSRDTQNATRSAHATRYRGQRMRGTLGLVLVASVSCPPPPPTHTQARGRRSPRGTRLPTADVTHPERGAEPASPAQSDADQDRRRQGGVRQGYALEAPCSLHLSTSSCNLAEASRSG